MHSSPRPLQRQWARSSKSQHFASIPEHVLVNWEEMARRGLEATSDMDSFLSGLVGTLSGPESDLLQLCQDLDAPVILTLVQGLEASSDAFARLHLNPILARRVSVLLAS